MNKIILRTVFLLFFSIANNSFAQYANDNHPELDWFTFETEHFFVHFHNGAERTAKLTGKIAEEIYEPVTELYQYQPDVKVHFILRDHDDYSNGGAYFYDNKIEIWATAMDFELRGSHNWLRNVLTHEFIHMIQIGSARKITQRVPAFYFQWIGYEDERRTDVLRGGPNKISSYPVAMTIMPSWFAEGVSQYQLPGLDYDTWDSHRDMILRTAIMDEKLLTYSEMGGFGKNSLGNEKSYNHGYAFVGYIADKYGVDALRQISVEMKKMFRLTIDGAIKKVTGKDAAVLYSEWKQYLESKYSFRLQNISSHQVAGQIIEPKGLGNFYPAWGRDDESYLYLSSLKSDFINTYGIKFFTPALNSGSGTVKCEPKHTASWSPDGQKIFFSGRGVKNTGGSKYFDIFTYDIKTKKTKRLTKGLRAHSPHLHFSGDKLVFIISVDGTENLAVFDLKKESLHYLTEHRNGEQLVHPQWSPDGKSIAYSQFVNSGQDIYIMDVATGKRETVLRDEFDARDPSFSPDGKQLYFSWDKTGIYNIYRMNLADRQIERLTNVVGGAFMPSVNRKGELLYSLFTSTGYKIALLENLAPIDDASAAYLEYEQDIKLASAASSLSPALQKQVQERRTYDDTEIPKYDTKAYKKQYGKPSVLPRAMIDYGTIKLGAYAYSWDVLDKYGILTGFAMNKRGDYDLFGLAEYREFGPTFFIEVYNQVQNTSIGVDSLDQVRLLGNGIISTEDKVKYNLLEVDIGVGFKFRKYNELRATLILSRYGAAFTDLRFKYKYFIGRDISLKFIHQNFASGLDADISPKGRFFYLAYDLEFNRFLRGFDPETTVGIEIFDDFRMNKIQAAWKEFIPLPIDNHSISLGLQAGFIDARVDSFFNFFGGGLGAPLASGVREPYQINSISNRGYSYYSMEGRKILQGRLTYNFPLIRHLDFGVGQLYLDKVFLSAFAEYGNAFDGKIKFDDFKTSVGGELRLETSSFYAYPTRFSLTAAYGLDEFENTGVVYGKEWKFYFGLTFGYFN